MRLALVVEVFGPGAKLRVPPRVPGEKGDMARFLSPPCDVMEEKVIELIGPDPGFGTLHRAVLASRHQFGRDIGLEDVEQDAVAGLVELMRGGGPADQILDQRLGHA